MPAKNCTNFKYSDIKISKKSHENEASSMKKQKKLATQGNCCKKINKWKEIKKTHTHRQSGAKFVSLESVEYGREKKSSS